MSYPRRILVRAAFSEEAVWRKALGPAEPLLIFAAYGPLDAPEYVPAGAMVSRQLGPCAALVSREAA